MNGGELVAETLAHHGSRFLFTLCGGHISPILTACHARGIRVIDTRNEAAAVFAADAVSRLTGIPGVAAVTAGPGVTNTVTAITNARLAQSPLVLLGGATAGILKGRGALQDIDQLAIMRPLTKWCASASRVRDIPRLVSLAFKRAQSGVAGPVFLELPVDLLYDEKVVREWFEKSGKANPLLRWYMSRYLNRQFDDDVAWRRTSPLAAAGEGSARGAGRVTDAAARLRAAQRPVIVAGSQIATPQSATAVAQACERIGAPVFLSGMARGILGSSSAVQVRHRRKEALRKADLVILAGVPSDFRLNYGRDIARDAVLVSANRSLHDLRKNRRPDVALHTDPASFLIALAEIGGVERPDWIGALHAADEEREVEIRALAEEKTEFINPVSLCRAIESAVAPDSIIIADGGDFVSTASYIVRPRAPLSWLDPGPYGTLGAGGGFALGAGVVRPGQELWLLYGDGALGFSLAEFDSFARHRIPVIAVVANDGCWSQIYREQVEMLGDDTGCMLARSDYHMAAEGLGGKGLLLREPGAIESTLREAQRLAAEGWPVLVNAWVGRTAFRKGSISM